ncbi:MAG: hypothetical protein AAF483_13650, partial [Planctomycetota bacterium]
MTSLDRAHLFVFALCLGLICTCAGKSIYAQEAGQDLPRHEVDPITRPADAPMPLSPEESKARMQVPEGFVLDLVAAEPVVQEPSCVAFDEFGRMFVSELHGYNVEGEIDVEQINKTGKLDRAVRRIRWELQRGDIAEQALEQQYGKVKLLVDSDADGVMDSFK